MITTPRGAASQCGTSRGPRNRRKRPTSSASRASRIAGTSTRWHYCGGWRAAAKVSSPNTSASTPARQKISRMSSCPSGAPPRSSSSTCRACKARSSGWTRARCSSRAHTAIRPACRARTKLLVWCTSRLLSTARRPVSGSPSRVASFRPTCRAMIGGRRFVPPWLRMRSTSSPGASTSFSTTARRSLRCSSPAASTSRRPRSPCASTPAAHARASS
mmetsp:Transcript_11300/g.37379  ORF Transcript_11300/g.37379 Transcript_11300/m.37379 type:complete len:217 (+) Transcript_11300:597-1247(+)